MTEIVYQTLKLNTRAADKKSRTVPAVLSTETPVERGEYFEILDHEGADLSRTKRGLPLIESHDQHRVNIGKVEDITISENRMVGNVRFGKSQRGKELFNDVADGIVDGVSIGYIVRKWEVDEDARTYTALDWMPFEVSAVSVPADPNAGFFRSTGIDEGFRAESEVEDPESLPEPVESEPPESVDVNGDDGRELELSNKEVRDMDDDKDKTQEPKEPAVDVKSVRNDAMSEERTRIAEITRIGKKFGQDDLADKFVENGRSVDEFRDEILGTMDGVELRSVGPEPIGLTENEVNKYSFLRAIRAMLPSASSKDIEAAAYEREVSEAAQKQYGRTAQGFMVPDDVTFKRDLTAGSSTKGADVVDTLGLRPESFIDLLRNAGVVERAGATTFRGLQGDVAIPRQTAGATAYWVAENSTVTESDQTFDQVTMTPQTVGAVTEISRRLLIQSSIDIEEFVRRDLATQIGIEIDRVAIEGSGTNNVPEGILNTSGIGAYSATSGTDAITWDLVVGLWKEVAVDNAAMGSLGWLASAPVIAKLLTTRMDTGSGRFIMESLGDGLLSYPMYRSENVPADLGSSGALGALIFGNMADLLIGYWSGVDVLVDPYSNSKTGAVRVVTMVDADVDVRHPQSFAATQDLVIA